MRMLASILFAFTLSQAANAALIDNGNYLTDTISGLDWLKLTQTTNRSYNGVSAQLGAGGEFAGWQYASGAQFEALLLNQGIAPDIGCADGTSFCGGATPSSYASIDSLVNLIGDTFEYANNGGTLTSASNAALGLLGDSALNGSAHYIGLLVGSYLSDTPYADTHYGDPQKDWLSASHIGSFLVRPSEVPIPASGYLFITVVSAVAGISGRRRLSKAKNQTLD